MIKMLERWSLKERTFFPLLDIRDFTCTLIDVEVSVCFISIS